MKVLVLGGGDSPEREVSLRSAKSVAQAARAAGFEVSQSDPAYDPAFFDGLTKDTIILPILHGAGGEDGILQKEMEKHDLAFLGSESFVSERCFDKWITRGDLVAEGIPMPKADLVTKESYPTHPLAREPHVLKIAHGGSSIGSLMVRNPAVPHDVQVNDIFNLRDSVIIEELIQGTEITVPILDQRALPVIEIVPPPQGEFDYENKYNGQSQEICPPKSVSADLQRDAQVLAEKVHHLMGARHLSRVDLMIDKQSNLYVLEINTIPGLTDQSLYPKSAAVAGLAMPQLVKQFVELVRRDYNL